MKHLTNLEELRTKLKDMPKLPPEKASHFCPTTTGDARPVPNKYGTFVLAIPSNLKTCMVYALRADSVKTEKLFTDMVSNAPAPLISRLAKDENGQTSTNGPTHTVSYEWSVTNAALKMLFTLTTASSDTAQLQALASASIIKD